MPTIVPIVEGVGDLSAAPDLLYRILWDKHDRADVVVAQGKKRVVVTNGRSNLVSKLAQFLGYAQNQGECDAILILLDSDDDCPVELAQRLSRRCREIGVRVPVEIVCAHREYESWFLASWDSVKEGAGFPDTTAPNRSVESVGDPKGWITELMPGGQTYKETSHQASYSTAIDLDLAHQNSRSFRRLCHALEQLVEAMAPGNPD